MSPENSGVLRVAVINWKGGQRKREEITVVIRYGRFVNKPVHSGHNMPLSFSFNYKLWRISCICSCCIYIFHMLRGKK